MSALAFDPWAALAHPGDDADLAAVRATCAAVAPALVGAFDAPDVVADRAAIAGLPFDWPDGPGAESDDMAEPTSAMLSGQAIDIARLESRTAAASHRLSPHSEPKTTVRCAPERRTGAQR